MLEVDETPKSKKQFKQNQLFLKKIAEPGKVFSFALQF